MRNIELLSPAKNADIAIEAILHGADAVYMGAASHGARKSAANSIDDIRRVADFAHIYRARVYATVNTLVYEHELRDVERLICDLYHAGVDALIVQDMGILRMDIPPIELHASTQCDIRTVEKAKFLEDVGFSQIVLARELSIGEIRNICENVTIPVETFVHGALCVSYSGRCNASYACKGRSANRGDCAQLCRLPYTMRDADGKTIEKDKHLLSLHDLNASDRIESLLQAGVSSFKIEGRLKDSTYVKNITALYRRVIDSLIAGHPHEYCRSSAGTSEISFTPQADKSFNRGFTHYFLDERRPCNLASLRTNKSMGERITDFSEIHNGDGISYFNSNGEYEGYRINNVSKTNFNREPWTSKEIFRTFDVEFEKQLAKATARRSLAIDISIDETGVSAIDERGVAARVALECEKEEARKPMDPTSIFNKLGTTEFRLRNFDNRLNPTTFIPASQMAETRRRLIEAMRYSAESVYPIKTRRPENRDAKYIKKIADYGDNIANSYAMAFYRDHGTTTKEYALEASDKPIEHGTVVMTCRHCVLRELGMCLQDEKRKRTFRLPLTIQSGTAKFGLHFDCGKCEMQVTTI